MTLKQKENYNKMARALRNITNFQSPEKMRKNSENDWGLEYEECLKMAYDNIQVMAKENVKGIRLIK